MMHDLSMKLLFPTFWKMEGLFKPCNKRSFFRLLLSHVMSFYCFIKKKPFFLLTSTAGPIQNFTLMIFFFNLKGTFWVKLLKLKRYFKKVWRCHFKKTPTNLTELSLSKTSRIKVCLTVTPACSPFSNKVWPISKHCSFPKTCKNERLLHTNCTSSVTFCWVADFVRKNKCLPCKNAVMLVMLLRIQNNSP